MTCAVRWCPNGTNLLGLVKHVASMEAGYFGETFGRPLREATAEESREDIVDLYRRVWEHSDATISLLELYAIGHVAWWAPEREQVTLHQILVHMIAETNRHAGHADIVRELIDGALGHRIDADNLPDFDQASWSTYRDQLERVAREAAAEFVVHDSGG